jgi:tetratricopeptide (TPR) repeat protein
MRGLAPALLLALLIPAAAHASESSERLYSRGLVELHAGRTAQAQALFDRAVDADPNDPYALYYRGVTRARAKDLAGGIADLRAALRKKPDFPEAALDLGVALIESGAYGEALPYLEQAQASPALEGNASLYMAIAELRLKEYDAARQSLRRAAAKDPTLALPALYYEALVDFEQGRNAQAEEHFQSVVTMSPSTEMGRQASAFLDQLRRGRRRRYRVYGALGLQYDSNVVLAPDDSAIKTEEGISNQADGRVVITAGGTYIPWHNDWAQVQLGYEFFQSLHFNLTDFDLQDHRPEVQIAARWNLLHLGVVGRYDFYLRETSSFLQEVATIPWVTVEEPGIGRADFYCRLRRRDFFQNDFEVRNAWNYAPGMRQYFYLGSPQRYLAVGYQFDREDPVIRSGATQEQRNQANAFAYDGNEVNFGFGWTLPWLVYTELGYAYRHEQYPDNSLFVPGGDSGRVDKIHQVTALLRRPIGPYVQVVAGYFGTFNNSNDPPFQYQRNIGSLTVEVSF